MAMKIHNNIPIMFYMAPSWTPAIGGLIVCVCVGGGGACVGACVRAFVRAFVRV